jgi:hypothetical protein
LKEIEKEDELDRLRFLFMGRELKDDVALCSYNPTNGSTIQSMFRPIPI